MTTKLSNVLRGNSYGFKISNTWCRYNLHDGIHNGLVFFI